MTTSRLLQVLVALIAGLLATSLARSWLADGSDAVAEAGENGPRLVPVLVAAASLEANQILDVAGVNLVAFPASIVPEGSFSSVEALSEHFGQEPVYADVNLVAGEPVLASRLRKEAWPKGASSNISAGMRAVALKADVMTSVAGLVAPGDYVDVLAPGQASSKSQVIVQAARVIAVDKEMNPGKNAENMPETLTLEVSPAQAALIVAAEQSGRLRLFLLPEAEDKTTSQPITVARKSRTAASASKAPGTNGAWTVRVTRGVEAETVSLAPAEPIGR